MSANPLQLFAVSALIGECRALAACGVLNPSQSAALRCLINHTQSAFDTSAAPTLPQSPSLSAHQQRKAS